MACGQPARAAHRAAASAAPPAPKAPKAPKAPTAWERGEYQVQGEEEASWQPAQPAQRGGGGGKAAAAAAAAWSAPTPSRAAAAAAAAASGAAAAHGSSGSGAPLGGGAGAVPSPLHAFGGSGPVACASKLIPLVGEEHPPNAVLKTSGAGSSFSKNGRGGAPGSGVLLKFQEGAQQRGTVLTVVPGNVVRK